MHIILSDNIMLKEYPLSINNMKKYIDNKSEENYLIVNIDTANIDVEKQVIYDIDYEINLFDIKTVLPRTDIYTDKLLSFMRIIQLNSNAKILNKGIYLCNNKLLSAIHTSNAGISTIPTYTLNSSNYSVFKDFPYVVKSVHGYSGREVFKINTENELEIIVKNMNKDLIIQPFREKGNVDYRIIIGNGKVLASFKRTASNGDFRANTSQGGIIEKIEISEDFKQMAVFTANVLKMDFVGLDFLEEDGNFEFCEANNSFKIASPDLGELICKEIEMISYL